LGIGNGLRAVVRIGELSRELEKAPPIRGDLISNDGKKITKAKTLADAGISTTTAQRGATLALSSYANRRIARSFAKLL
jgi:hypothetical protein